MKRAKERDDVRPLRVITRELQGALDGLGAGVAVVDFVRAGHGRDLRQALGQRDHALVIKVGTRHVDEFGGLLLHGSDYVRMAVAG